MGLGLPWALNTASLSQISTSLITVGLEKLFLAVTGQPNNEKDKDRFPSICGFGFFSSSWVSLP